MSYARMLRRLPGYNALYHYYQRFRQHGFVTTLKHLWWWRWLRRQLLLEVLRDIGWSTARVRTEFGTLEVCLHDPFIGERLFLYGHYERHVACIMRRVLGNGMIVLDIGANIGYYALLFSKHIGTNGKVIAFEPEPENYELLIRNCRLNRLSNVVALQVALGPIEGSHLLFLDDLNRGDHRCYCPQGERRRTVSVSMRSGDSVLKELGVNCVDLIKVDVQGWELHVFRGLTEIMKHSPNCIVFCEWWPYGVRQAGGNPEELYWLLTAGERMGVVLGDNPQIIESYQSLERELTSKDGEAEGSKHLDIMFASRDVIRRLELA